MRERERERVRDTQLERGRPLVGSRGLTQRGKKVIQGQLTWRDDTEASNTEIG